MDRMGRIDWDDFNVLRALALAGSTARAGKGLGLSHQTVARRLRRLESGVGGALVDRSGSRWGLTPLGRQVADRAEAMAQIVNGAAVLSRPAVSGLAGRVTLAAPRWIVPLAVLPALAVLRGRHPGLQFDLLPEAAAADLSLVAARTMPPGPSARRLASLSASLYGTPASVARMEAALGADDLNMHAFSQTRPHLVTLEAGGGGNVTRVQDFETLVEAVRSGLGVAVLPDVVGRALAGIVACSAIDLPRGSLALWCVSDAETPRAAMLREVEREILRACRRLLSA
ncbi:MAG: LysR family transcriptional regulator [Pseudooceanicola sp.]|nr:LysR family transcriptional regulator [Pseudooceanicola sp.]